MDFGAVAIPVETVIESRTISTGIENIFRDSL